MNCRFDVLDGFRGLSALFVVVFHLSIFNSFSELVFFRNSFYFVEFFFILSGFVLTHSCSSSPLRPFKYFITARFFRLFPLHVYMLLVFIFLELLKLIAFNYGVSFNNEPFTGNTDLYELLPNLLLLHAWSPFTNELSFNYLSWSVSIEFYLYVIFYSTLLLGKKLRLLSWFSLVSVTILLIITNSDVIVTSVERGISGFFSGVIMYQIFIKSSRFMTMKNTCFSVLEFISILSIIISLSFNYPYQDIIIKFIFCVSIYLFAFENGVFSKIINSERIKLLGKLSFSIYMIHGAVIFLIVSLFIILDKFTLSELTFMQGKQRFISTGTFFGDNILTLAILLIVIYLATFSYKYIELKGIDLGKRILNKNQVGKSI